MDLLGRSQPEERRRVQPVEVRNEAWQRQAKEQNVRCKEVGSEERHLDDLDHKFSGGLAEGVSTKATAVPASRPPSTVGLVVLELSRKHQSDENLKDGSLDGDPAFDIGLVPSNRSTPLYELPMASSIFFLVATIFSFLS